MARRNPAKRRAKLTKTLVASLKHEGPEDRCLWWDTEQPGFYAVVHRSGSKTFCVCYRPFSGQLRRQSIGKWPTWSVEEARREAAQILAAVDRGADPLGDRKAERARRADTLAAFWAGPYLEHAAPRWKPRTASKNDQLWRTHLEPAFGEKPLRSLTVGDLARWHSGLKGSPVAANNAAKLLRAMLARAVALGLIEKNPAAQVELFKERKRERFLDAAELGALWDAIADEERLGGVASVERLAPDDAALVQLEGAPGSPFRRRRDGGIDRRQLGEAKGRGISPHAAACLRLLVLTGARLREVAACRWEWVNTTARCLDLPDSKTGAKRVPLNDAALDILAGLRKRRTSGNPFVIEGQQPGRPLVNLAKPWARVLARAGELLNTRRREQGLDPLATPFAGVRLHDLRHTFASWGVARGLPLLTVGRVLGHAQVATTARYGHLADDPILAAANEVGAAILDAVKRPAAPVETIGPASKAAGEGRD